MLITEANFVGLNYIFLLSKLKPGDVKKEFPDCDLCQCVDGTTTCSKADSCSETTCGSQVSNINHNNEGAPFPNGG